MISGNPRRRNQKKGRTTASPLCPLRRQMKDPAERRHEFETKVRLDLSEGRVTVRACRLCGTIEGDEAQKIETELSKAIKEARHSLGVRR